MRREKFFLLMLAALLSFHVLAQTSANLRIVTCASPGGRVYCPADATFGVRLQQQLGKTACTESSSWGYDVHGIWVERGCKGLFVLGDRKHDFIRSNSPYPGMRMINCSSENDGRQVCDADTRFGITLTRQLSDKDCVFNQTWGYDDWHVWVSRGCRADFALGH
jgi:hypothetical protein